MPRYIVPLCVEVEVEADDPLAAVSEAQRWRDSLLDTMSGNLRPQGVCRFRMAPLREVLEVDAAWLENRCLRPEQRLPWRYTSQEIALRPGSSVTIVHRVALGPGHPEAAS